jgi:hypothetical protein
VEAWVAALAEPEVAATDQPLTEPQLVVAAVASAEDEEAVAASIDPKGNMTMIVLNLYIISVVFLKMMSVLMRTHITENK